MATSLLPLCTDAELASLLNDLSIEDHDDRIVELINAVDQELTLRGIDGAAVMTG